MRAPIRFRNPLAFPGGVLPGINWTHPAIGPGGQSTLQSWIPSGKTLINLTNGAKAGTVGTVTAANSILGPAVAYPIGANNYNSYSPTAQSWAAVTFGSIFVPTVASTGAWIIGTNNNSLSWLQYIQNMSPAFSNAGNVFKFTNMPTFVVGQPYFYAMTLRNSLQYVVVNLATGQTWSDTFTSMGRAEHATSPVRFYSGRYLVFQVMRSRSTIPLSASTRSSHGRNARGTSGIRQL